MGPSSTWVLLSGVYLDEVFPRRRRMSLPLVLFAVLVVMFLVFVVWGR